MRRNALLISLAMALVVLSAACGQKPEVAKQLEGTNLLAGIGGGLPPGATVDEEGNIISAEGEIIGNVEEGITDPDVLAAAGGDTSGLGTGSSTGGTGTGDDGGGDDGGGDGTLPPSGESAPDGGNATGVTDKVIKIGIHAPLTGAAPVPSDSVDKGKDLYFRYMAAQNKSVHGRSVETVLKNDQYNPSTAVAVCKEMVEKDKVFLLSGSAGTDQIQACARYSESVGVPYVSAGVTEALVSGFRTYFTTSMTYPDQAPLLVDYMKSKLGAAGEKNGMLFFDTASFKDAHDTFKAAAAEAGVPISYDRQVSKNAGTSEARQVVQEMNLEGIENVFVLTSPVWWLQVLKQADTQAFQPQWVGVGISMTFDTVASVGCGGGQSIDGSKFFSPFPAWIDRARYDGDFDKAYNQFYGNSGKPSDDFVWLAWSGTKVIWEMLLETGAEPTREKFIYAVERMRNLRNGIGPVLNYSPTNHFGADSTYVSEARCSTRRWHTIVTSPASDF
jgi:branched-chain amino acid transport system substrate-binding protein